MLSKLRVIIMAGPKPSVDHYVIDRLDFFVGRADASSTIGSPVVALELDGLVSRRHVRVFRDRTRLLIQDLGSKHGTIVDGREIKNVGPVAFLPGTPVRTGDYVWTVLPEEWLWAKCDGVLLYASCASVVNCALIHCENNLIGTMTARNFGTAYSPLVHLTLSIDPLSDPVTMQVPPLAPGAASTLQPPRIPIQSNRLMQITGLQNCSVHVAVNGVAMPRSSKELVVCGMWDWAYGPEARKTLAAFVSPRHPDVERVVLEAEAGLGKGITFDRLLKAGGDDGEKACVTAIYNALVRRQIRYVMPHLDALPGERQLYQRVLTPDKFLGAASSATCLDLALLFAACLERIRLLPLVFLTGDDASRPLHAFAGCWTGPAPAPVDIIEDRAALARDLKAGALIVIESTGVAAGFCSEPLTASEAMTHAQQSLAQAQWLCAVNIGALHPPHGRITPLDRPFAALVEAALARAFEFARKNNHPSVSMMHLLYGLLAAQGPIVQAVMSDFGRSATELAGRLEQLVKPGKTAAEPAPTLNFRQCQQLGAEMAWRAEAPCMREEDLLWALLLMGPSSRSFLNTCSKLHLDLITLTAILEQRLSKPRFMVHSSSSSYGLSE